MIRYCNHLPGNGLTALLLATVIVISGCQTPNASAPNAATPGPRDSSKLLVVDCLLPGQVRKLGNLTYLSPRNPIKTSAAECEIRGGEYVAFDRSDYRTALQVWLEQAKQGNAEAQNYVGEIYEKGLGVDPNYPLAAQWYQKAADQGYSRAQTNIGYLYEKGLGVEKDKIKAFNWYRRASGLEDELYLSSVSEQSANETQEKYEELLSDQERRRIEIEGLAGDLDETRDALERSRKQIHLERKRKIAAQQEAELSRMQAAWLQANLTAGGPSIEILEPPMVTTRSSDLPSIRLRSATTNPVIIGVARAPAGLQSVVVNERPTRVDEQGVFRLNVPGVKSETPVQVVALDKLGQRASLEFNLVPLGGNIPVATSAEVADTPTRTRLNINFGRYHALVIGNNNYPNLPTLKTAVNDARTTAEVLKSKYGFRTTLLENATRYEILSALNTLRESLTEDDNLLIYYAGHGELDHNDLQGYWLPVDAESENPANWISNRAISEILNATAARHVMVVADSCYSGAMSRSSIARLGKSLPEDKRRKWLKTMAKTRSRTVLTSGGVKPVLDSGGGNHSAFAKAFLQALNSNKGILEGFRIYGQIANQVRQAAARLQIEQVPRYSPIRHAGHAAGEFLFVPTSG